MIPDDTGPMLRGDNFPCELRLFFLPKKATLSNCFTKYNHGRVVASVSKAATVSQNDGTHHGTVDSMKSWAITSSLLSHCVPKASIIKPRPIAPARLAPRAEQRLRYAEMVDFSRDEKQERRKITKRLAARRSNARRKRQIVLAQTKVKGNTNTVSDFDALNAGKK